jgi:hypothetical protein
MRSPDEVVYRDAGQSALVSVAVGVGSFGVTLLLAVLARWPWWSAPLAGVVGGSVTFAVVAVLLVTDSRSWLWRLETVAGVDVDGDEVIGAPEYESGALAEAEPERSFVYVRNVKAEQKRRRARDFREFLKGAYNGKGTTWRSWKGERLPSGERVTRPVWEEYTERLERAGLGSRPYETASLELTSDYRDALETFAEVL